MCKRVFTNQTAKRTNKEIVEIKEIQLSHEQLKRLEGDYELDPSFIISVKTRERRLFAQATGQPEFELFAESPLKFFLKVFENLLNRNFPRSHQQDVELF